MSFTARDDQLAVQVAEVLGREQVILTRVVAGASRGAYLVAAAPGAEPCAFLLVDEGGGGLSGTSLNLHREADLLRRLAGCGVLVPRILGVLQEPLALLMAYEKGHARLEPGEAESVGPAYMAHLAGIHRLDPLSVLPDAPATAEEAVRADLAWWSDLADSSGAAQLPLVALAGALLASHLPSSDAPAVVVHGDAGAGNFLVHAGTITTLLDWELCHAGDWHEDLGWLHARMVFTPFGTLADRYAEYEAAAGVQIDPRRLLWSQAFAAWKCVVAVESRLRTPDPGISALVSQYVTLAYQPVLASLLIELLDGGSLTTPEEVSEVRSGELKLLDELLHEPLSDGARAAVRHLQALEARRSGFAAARGDDLRAAGLSTDEMTGLGTPEAVLLLKALGREALRRASTSTRVERLLTSARTNGLLP